MTRPTFEEVCMRTAHDIARRSTCLRLKVGAVITTTDFRSILSWGFNGNAAGLPNTCDRTGEAAVGSCGCLHAEANAIVNCAAPRSVEKYIFCTHLPCVACSKLLVNLGGVRKVFYGADYRIRDSLEIFKTVGIEAEFMPERPPPLDAALVGNPTTTSTNKET